MIGLGIGPGFGGRAFNPALLPSLIGYWTADLSTLDAVNDTDPVGSMASIAPASATLTEASAKPVLKLAAGPTGRNVLRFTQASSHKLVDSAIIGAALSGSGIPFSVTTVAKVTGAGNNSTWGMGHGTSTQKGAFSNRRAMGTPLLNLYHTNDANATTTVGESALMCDNYWHVDTIVFDGTNVLLYVDGALQDVATAWGNASTVMNRFAIGCTIGASTYANFASMDWAATVVNSVALSSLDVRRLHVYLAARYLGITLGAWISRDEYTTNAANPLTSPRALEPGPGRATLLDTGSHLSIASQKLHIDGGAAYDPAVYQGLRPGSAGLMFRTGFWLPGPNVTSGFWAGLGANTTTVAGGMVTCVTNYIRGCQNGVGVYDGRTICPSTDTWTDPKYFEAAVICKGGGTGAYCLVRRPGMTKWTLVWVDSAASLATCYPRMAAAGKILDVDNTTLLLEGINLPSYVGYSAALTAGQTIAGHVDGLVYATFTAETGLTKEVKVRYTDADNCVVIRCDQGGSLLKVVERVAGVENQLLSVAQTWTNGTSYRVGVSMDWQSIVVSVNASASSSTGCLSTVLLGTVPSSATLVCGSHDMTEVSAWPKYHDAGDGTCAVPRGIFACGDSITRGEMDIDGNGQFLPYPLDQCGWPQRLCALLGGEEVPKRYAVGGHTVAKQLADIGTSLNGFLGTPSDVVTMHGSNEMTTMPTEAQFKLDYLALIATWHRKWPDATVWLMIPWRRGKAVEMVLIAQWIRDIVADPSVSAFTRVGADCQTFMAGSDDGVTNTYDGTHPNRAGHILMAAAQAALMA